MFLYWFPVKALDDYRTKKTRFIYFCYFSWLTRFSRLVAMVTQYYFQRFRNYQLLEILFGDFLCRLGFQQSSASVPLALRTKEAGPGQKGNLGPGLAEGWCLWVCAESCHRQVASAIGPHWMCHLPEAVGKSRGHERACFWSHLYLSVVTVSPGLGPLPCLLRTLPLAHLSPSWTPLLWPKKKKKSNFRILLETLTSVLP